MIVINNAHGWYFRNTNILSPLKGSSFYSFLSLFRPPSLLSATIFSQSHFCSGFSGRRVDFLLRKLGLLFTAACNKIC
ncbi:hypothetical protein H6P81_004756 [Aristolochia fimbriata]|uniref:Uncharacterized protein n=1 Tax=Aristolochia fimbriata TaxID=158543 RepID=A0AAV7ESM9_ARIFI|nr:hypothetical protein H6P81_004756 [Aristolochia fimbriata]